MFFMPDDLEFVYFFHCQKSNKKSSGPKNSLIRQRNCSISWFAGTLICISLSYFYRLLLPDRYLLSNEIGFRVAQTVLAHCPKYENDFQNNVFRKLSSIAFELRAGLLRTKEAGTSSALPPTLSVQFHN